MRQRPCIVALLLSLLLLTPLAAAAETVMLPYEHDLPSSHGRLSGAGTYVNPYSLQAEPTGYQETVYFPLLAHSISINDDSVWREIGPGGGTLAHPSGFALTVAADSIPTTQRFVIRAANALPAPLPLGYALAGRPVQLEPGGIFFGAPVTVSLPLPSGAEPSQVVVYSYDGVEDGWKLLGGQVKGEQIVVETCSFSWLAVAIPTNYQREYGHKAIRFSNRAQEPVVISMKYWALTYPYRDPGPARSWSLSLAVEGQDGAHVGCNGFFQGAYEFWAYFPESDRTCSLGPIELSADSSPLCEEGEVLLVECAPDDPESFAGRPTADIPGQPVLRTGALAFTLRWSARADLDLHVQLGSREYIWYAEPGPTASGGRLDKDSVCYNYGQESFGVEHVFWPNGAAPAGTYTVSVAYFDNCGTGARDIPFRLEVRDESGRFQSWSAEVEQAQTSSTDVNVPIDEIPESSKWSTVWPPSG